MQRYDNTYDKRVFSVILRGTQRHETVKHAIDSGCQIRYMSIEYIIIITVEPYRKFRFAIVRFLACSLVNLIDLADETCQMCGA